RYTDLELVLSDNGSTDATREICLEAVAQDTRVRYFRSEVNRGLAWNFNNAFQQARGRFLVWLGHDDLLGPHFLTECLAALERDPQCVVCFTNTNYIDAEGNLIQGADLQNSGAAPGAAERFRDVLYDGKCDPICGLMRTDVLRQTRLHGRYADSDRVLLGEMALRGRFAKVPRHLFSRRSHGAQTSAAKDRWARTLIFDPGAAGKAICPWWREFFALVAAIRRSPLTLREKWQALKYFYWWSSHHKEYLYRDLQRGLKSVTERILSR
ncbi:MAG: glycosyltransferase family 2 protein, partial [Steroidobacteraceae bacterium]